MPILHQKALSQPCKTKPGKKYGIGYYNNPYYHNKKSCIEVYDQFTIPFQDKVIDIYLTKSK